MRQLNRFAMLVICAATFLCAAPARAQVEPMTPEHCGAEVLPATTIYMLEYRDLGDTVRRARETSIYRIFTDPAVREYLDPHLEPLMEAIEEMDRILQETPGISLDEIAGILDGRLTIAILDMAAIPRFNMRTALLLTPTDTQRLNDLLDKIIPEDLRLLADIRTRHGIEINRIGEGATAVSWAIAANTLVLGIGEGTVGAIIDRMATPGDSLFTTPTFASAYNKVFGYNRDFMVYVNIEHIVNMINALGSEEIRNVIAQFNLTGVKGLAVAGQIEGDGVEDILYLHMPGEPRGFTDIISPAPVDMSLLEIIPADATGLALFRLNPLAAYDFFIDTVLQLNFEAHEEMMEDIGEFEDEAGFPIRADLLAALAGEIVIFDARPQFEEQLERLAAAEEKKEVETILAISSLGNMIHVATINDRERIERALDALTNYILEKDMEEAGLEERVDMEELRFEYDTHRGATVKYLAGIEELNIRPGYAITDRFLIMAGEIDLVLKTIDRLEDGGDSVLDSALWAEARRHIPDDCGGIFALDISRMTDYIQLLVESIKRIEEFPGDEDDIADAEADIAENDFMALAGIVARSFDLFNVDFDFKYPEAIVEAVKRENMILVMSIKSHPGEGLSIQGRSPFGTVANAPNLTTSGTLSGFLTAMRISARMRGRGIQADQPPPPADWDF